MADVESGVAVGRAALRHGDPVAAAEHLRAALACWRGEAYAEFADEPWAHPESQRLGELRLAAEELLVEAELACGHTAEVLPALESLCREHPLREAFRVQLMTAYYRAGRQADALAVFRGFRAELADELGIDPSPALVELEQRVLVQAPGLLLPPSSEPLRGYRLGERLGTGGVGTVHAARLPGVDRELVVKTLRADLADHPSFVRSFDATAQRVASLRHAAAVPIHDWWREPGAAHVVMPRLPGGSLRDRLQRAPLGQREVVTLVERLGGVLAEAAALGLVHGRVTVDNVLYDRSGHPVLTDFWLGGPDPPSAEEDVRAFAALVAEVLERAGVEARVAHVLEQTEPSSVGELTDRLLTALGAAGPVEQRGRNPYQGLRAFDEADADYYFGRAALVDDVVARLSGEGLRSRLVLLVGASGTGKSSAVRAGLLPRLRAGDASGSASWFLATMLPGGAPYKELAESLRAVAVDDADGLAERLSGVDGIDRVLRRVVPEGGQLLLVVDQFEELFTLSPEAEQREFLEALTHALSVPESRLRVVATLRADYYDRPLGVQPFGSLVQDATVTIPAMLPAEVEAAVVEPAQRAGRSVERALAAELVGVLATEPTALPALQFVLYELADRSPGGALTLGAYRELGGIDGAIAARAEELYLSLDDPERQQVRALFEQLVVVGAEGEPTRRRARRGELPDSADAVDRWAAARLLTLDVHPQTRVPTVEVAHEALIREWPRLRQWIEDDRSELVVLGRTREAAAAWAALDREPSALLRGTTLEAALDVADGRGVLGPLEAEFVEASRAARDAQRAVQADLIRRQAGTNRRLRLQLVAIAAALVVALVGGLVAVNQREQAVGERHIAVARELAAAADANIRDDPERSILLALAAVDATRRHDEPVLPEALEALHRGVASARILRSFPWVGGTLDWSADGRLFVTEGTEESGMVDIRDAVTGETVTSFKGDEVDINDVAFTRDGTRVVVASDEGAVRVWDIATGRKLGDVTVGSEGAVWGPSVSPDGRLAAGAWLEAGKVRVFPTTGGKPWVFLTDVPIDTAFSPDGRRLAVASAAGDVHVVDVATRREVRVHRGGEGARDVAWSPDGRWLAATSVVGVRVYDVVTGRLRHTTWGHTGPVTGVAWSPDSRRLATASDDGTARVFAIEGSAPRELVRLAAQDMRNGVRSVAFSPDGTELMTSDWAVTSVKVWDVSGEGAAEIVNIAGEGGSDCWTALAPDGRSVWVSEPGGALGRYDMTTGRRVQRLPPSPVGPPHIRCLEPSPDGRLLAAGGWDLPFPVWDTRTGEVAFVVGEGTEGHAGDMAWDGPGDHLAVSVTRTGTRAGQETTLASTVHVHDRTGAVVGTVSGEPDVVIAGLSFRADGDVIATTAETGRDDPSLWGIRLWDWRRDRLIRRIDGNTVDAVFDPAGTRLVTTRLIQGVAEVWDARSGERLSSLEGHTGIVIDVAFDRTGERVATASVDGSVRIWDPDTGRQHLVLRLAAPEPALSVQFSPDGRRLVTTWGDGTTRVWTPDLDELVAIARERVTRGLTTAECRQYLRTPSCPQE